MPWYWILIIVSAIIGPFEAMYALNKAKLNKEKAVKKDGEKQYGPKYPDNTRQG